MISRYVQYKQLLYTLIENLLLEPMNCNYSFRSGILANISFRTTFAVHDVISISKLFNHNRTIGVSKLAGKLNYFRDFRLPVHQIF